MKQTNNYQLNVWDKTDRIQMEDFNEDNAKVEAALTAVNTRVDALAASKAEQSALNAEKAARESRDAALEATNCWVKLQEVPIGAVHQVDVSVSGINWDLYRKVVIELSVQTAPQSTYANLRLNGLSTKIYYGSELSDPADHLYICPRCSSGGISTVTLAAAPNGTAMGFICSSGFDSMPFSENTGFWVKGVQLNQVTSLQFFVDGSYKFVSGRVALYGLKR